MGYFSEASYDREDREQNRPKNKKINKDINAERQQLLHQMYELTEKKYFARYGKQDKASLYDYKETHEETEDLGHYGSRH